MGVGMGWRESIAEFNDRDLARAKFHEWCQTKADVHREIEFVGRNNDVATLHINTEDNHLARDLTGRFNRGAHPIRVISVNGHAENVVELEVCLTELKVEDGHP